jgi:hypothetical protein
VNGPTDAAKGLFAGGDIDGDGAVAWVQGSTGALSIDAAELVTAPAGGGQKGVVYTKSNAPLLAWRAARESWGPVVYTVSLDGSTVGQTSSNLGWQVPGPLADGPHSYHVTVANQASQSGTTLSQTLFVDTYPPTLQTKLGGELQSGTKLTMTLRYTDPPNPSEPGSQPSGIAAETVNWGDRTAPVTGRKMLRATHVYSHSGSYIVTVTVTDRAGNATTKTRTLVIKPKPKPKRKSRLKRKAHVKRTLHMRHKPTPQSAQHHA